MKHKNFTLGGFCLGFLYGGFCWGVYAQRVFVLGPTTGPFQIQLRSGDAVPPPLSGSGQSADRGRGSEALKAPEYLHFKTPKMS